MAWRDATAGQSIVIVANGAIRATQVVTGVLVIFLYVNEKGYWDHCGLPGKINYEFVLASFAIVTGLILGFVPFTMSYRPVALAAPWDAIMFFMYCAAFGVIRKANDALDTDCAKWKDFKDNEYLDHFLSMQHKVWVNLAGMILFLISAIMGAVLVWVGGKNGRTGRHSAV